MARDHESATASSGGQSKRPAFAQHDSNDAPSDSPSTSTTSTVAHSHQQRPQKQHHNRNHPVGRFHGRVPSSKALHKHHGPPGAKLTRRITSPPPEVDHSARITAHRRATSEVKLARPSSSGNLAKSASQTSLKRHRSHVEVGKRNKSSDKLKRLSGGASGSTRPTSSKSQVHFDLGTEQDDQEDQDDEWVDASGSNSPYLSRKGSINSNPSTRPGASGGNSRAESPEETVQKADPEPEPSTPERQRTQQKEYLTSRLLQRTPSYGAGAAPKMSAEIARVPPKSPINVDGASHTASSTFAGSSKDELTSRFVEGVGSGLPGEGSFGRLLPANSVRSEEAPRQLQSSAGYEEREADSGIDSTAKDNIRSALVPGPGRRTAAKPAEASRVQQKLNLQRASSAIEPGQSMAAVAGIPGANPLGGPAFDGGSNGPRINKLLERTGMEYLVVRRYQNPIARSLKRTSQLPGADKSKRISRINTGSISGRRSLEGPRGHLRNVSLTEARRPTTPKTTSIKTNGAGSSYEDDETRLNDGLSGSSLVGGDEEDGTTAMLRNMWEKSMDLSASTD